MPPPRAGPLPWQWPLPRQAPALLSPQIPAGSATSPPRATPPPQQQAPELQPLQAHGRQEAAGRARAPRRPARRPVASRARRPGRRRPALPGPALRQRCWAAATYPLARVPLQLRLALTPRTSDPPGHPKLARPGPPQLQGARGLRRSHRSSWAAPLGWRPRQLGRGQGRPRQCCCLLRWQRRRRSRHPRSQRSPARRPS
mmetsp:Transcript_20366/g.64041  ORF Transcript_20366/g.64041 Transcript_20366/m.64041 type:complete len:200 (+) Transcript_20366:1936-2535(+)